MKNYIVIILVVAAVVGGLGFFGGMKYQESKAPTGGRQFAGGPNGFGGNRQGRNGGGLGGRPVAGEILSADDKSITVKLQDGSSKIVLLSDKTSINKAAEGSKADLKTGERVAAFGTENADGSIMASNIQLNPQLGRGVGRAPNQAQKSPDAREIVVTGANYSFSPSSITVKKGEKIRILFKNSDGMHDFRIDELGVATAVVQKGQEDFVEFTPDKTGSFEFYCGVANHRAMGMKGTLVVQ